MTLPRISSASGSRVRWRRYLPPMLVGAAMLGGWEGAVRYWDIPPYKLPAPTAVGGAVVEHWPELLAAWWVTLKTMFVALAAAVLLGVAAAALFASSPAIENSFFPYAVMLQVTPLVAVAPFIVIWIGYDRLWLTQLVCAWIVAFFPILANTTLGLRSADRGLRNLFDLYGASPWQRLSLLLAPSALPYFLAGLKVSANLALVGAVVAEFITGTQVENPGLASTIFTSQLNGDTRTMFAALGLISFTGVATFFAMHAVSWLLLKNWHDSALAAES